MRIKGVFKIPIYPNSSTKIKYCTNNTQTLLTTTTNNSLYITTSISKENLWAKRNQQFKSVLNHKNPFKRLLFETKSFFNQFETLKSPNPNSASHKMRPKINRKMGGKEKKSSPTSTRELHAPISLLSPEFHQKSATQMCRPNRWTKRKRNSEENRGGKKHDLRNEENGRHLPSTAAAHHRTRRKTWRTKMTSKEVVRNELGSEDSKRN